MRGTIIDISEGRDKRARVTLSLPHNALDGLYKLSDGEVAVEIKKYREKRSLDANAYAWLLIGKIAEAIRPPLSKDEVYLEMLRHYGQSGVVSVREKAKDAFLRAYRYAEEIGEATLNGKKFAHIKFYIGSSNYDTKEMSLFIDGIVEEAKALGIDTDVPYIKGLLEG